MDKERENEIKSKLGLPDNSRIIEVTESSWLKASDNYAGREQFGYGYNVDDLPVLTEDEFRKFFREEKYAREKLDGVDIFDKTSEEIASLVEKDNLVNELRVWIQLHRRNILHRIRAKYGDILIMPTSESLVRAAEILDTTNPESIQ